MNPNATILRHPLIEHKLAILRNRDTDNKHFRKTLNELSYLLVYEITRDLALKPVRIQTPLAPCDAQQLAEHLRDFGGGREVACGAHGRGVAVVTETGMTQRLGHEVGQRDRPGERDAPRDQAAQLAVGHGWGPYGSSGLR